MGGRDLDDDLFWDDEISLGRSLPPTTLLIGLSLVYVIFLRARGNMSSESSPVVSCRIRSINPLLRKKAFKNCHELLDKAFSCCLLVLGLLFIEVSGSWVYSKSLMPRDELIFKTRASFPMYQHADWVYLSVFEYVVT